MKPAWQTFQDLAEHARLDGPPRIDVRSAVLARIALQSRLVPQSLVADEPLWLPVALASSLTLAAAVAVWFALTPASGSDTALAGWFDLVLWNVRY